METNLVLCSRFHWAEGEACCVFAATALCRELGIDPPPDESPAVSLRIRVKDGEKGGNDDGAR